VGRVETSERAISNTFSPVRLFILPQAVEAAARLGMYKKKYLEKARLMFEQMLGK
jgi:hypothetical protein